MSDLADACKATGIYFSDVKWIYEVLKIFASGFLCGYGMHVAKVARDEMAKLEGKK